MVRLLTKVVLCWVLSLSTFSKFARLLKWTTFGSVCLQYKAFGGPKTGTLSQILRRSNYSWLFWLVKHKLMKCNIFLSNDTQLKSLFKIKIFWTSHSFFKFNTNKVMSTIGVYIFLVTCENLTTYWRRHFICSLSPLKFDWLL